MVAERASGDVLPERASAVVFPGQGAVHPRMRADVIAEAPELYELVCQVADGDPFDSLDDPRCAQAALVCRSLASWTTIRHAVKPVAFAGHSLGELAAFVAAGALEPREALRLAWRRGALTSPLTEGGGMVAVIGLASADARLLARDHGLGVAAFNSPTQTVLTGPLAALERASEAADRAGARSLRLGVKGAFHSKAMQGAVSPFAKELGNAAFAPARVPVYVNMTARPSISPILELSLILVSPVRWHEVVGALSEQGVRRLVQAAPGDVLCGLSRQCCPELEAITATMLLAEVSVRA